VIPSLPGHGFSGMPAALGWDPVRIARAWIVLMGRLGYSRYVAQGGDWGNAVTEQMALLAPPQLVGIHTNMPATVPDDIAKALQSQGLPPPGLTADEKYAYDQLDFFYKHGLSYAQEMSSRPQTLYAIDDSPVGLAAWMLDHDARSYALIARVFAGQPEGLTRDDILDNVTLYWLTNTAVSSARLYWESKLAFFAPKGVAIPVAVSAFPDEIYTAPRSWAEKAYPRLVHYNRLPKGRHFAAWEQPKSLSEELRASFRTLRGAAQPSLASGRDRLPTLDDRVRPVLKCRGDAARGIRPALCPFEPPGVNPGRGLLADPSSTGLRPGAPGVSLLLGSGAPANWSHS
jgi:pimeloyl-ACP methyl ester carboxylesterase